MTVPVTRSTAWYGRRHRWFVVLVLALWFVLVTLGPLAAWLLLAGP